MSRIIHIISMLLILFSGGGCEQPPQTPEPPLPAIQGITLADLQAQEPVLPEQALLSFSVLTYTLAVQSLDSLEYLVESLSQGRIRYDNAGAFAANGFAIGCGTHEEGSATARRLRDIGAVRTVQHTVLTPSGSNEILYSVPITEPQTIIFSTSGTGAGGLQATRGKLGWILSARPVESVEDTAQVMMCPAFWEVGASDLRLLSGQEPFQFQFFDVAHVQFPMQRGQFCLLAPTRAVKGRDTLDRFLFQVPGRDEIVFYVIIYGGARDIDSR